MASQRDTLELILAAQPPGKIHLGPPDIFLNLLLPGDPGRGVRLGISPSIPVTNLPAKLRPGLPFGGACVIEQFTRDKNRRQRIQALAEDRRSREEPRLHEAVGFLFAPAPGSFTHLSKAPGCETTPMGQIPMAGEQRDLVEELQYRHQADLFIRQSRIDQPHEQLGSQYVFSFSRRVGLPLRMAQTIGRASSQPGL